MTRFIIPAALLTAALPLATRWFWLQGWIPGVPSFMYFTTGVVAFLTTVIFAYLYAMDSPSMFVRFYLLSLVIKILAALAYCVVMVLKDPAGRTINVVYFLVVYLAFTALEIVLLYRRIDSSHRP